MVGHAKARMIMLAGGTTEFRTAFNRSIDRTIEREWPIGVVSVLLRGPVEEIRSQRDREGLAHVRHAHTTRRGCRTRARRV